MTHTKRRDGYALITSLMVTLVVTGLVVGFISTVATEQKIAANDTDYSSAFYAAEAGLEKLNADLSKLFQQSVFPTQAAVADIQADGARPAIPRVTYSMYQVIGGQSTRLTAAMDADDTAASVISTDGWPTSGYFMIDSEEFTYSGVTANSFTGLVRTSPAPHVNNANVSRARVITIGEGPNAGLNAQVIPFSLEVVAQAGAGSEARLNREVQVALIPVFQFGVFSDSDLSFFAGPQFNFGGRVHTNGDLFLAANTGTWLSQKVTAAGDVIRQELANGVAVTGPRTGPVYVLQSTGPCVPPAAGSCRDLAETEGSLEGGPGSTPNSSWTGISLSTYNGNILNKDTGAKPLTLPFAGGDASPIEIIRRPPDGEDVNSIIGQSRLYNQASLRILLSDTEAALPGDSGVPLNSAITGAPHNYVVADGSGGTTFRPPFAAADPANVDFIEADNDDETTAAELIDGYIKIQRQNADATWSDVTMEILNLGISSNQTDAVLRFQRPRFDAVDVTNSTTATDYVPINMYDARESHWRITGYPGTSLRKLGIMNLVELDVANLARWFAGTISAAGSTGAQAISNNGYIVYFSDRRGNRDDMGDETGEFGFEDVVNPDGAPGNPNGVLDDGEDLNDNDALETYGANLPYGPAGTASTDIYTTGIVRQGTRFPSELGAAVTNTGTAINVASTAIMNLGAYRIGDEILDCTARETDNADARDTFTCTRGAAGTTAAAHTISVYNELDEDLDDSETDIDVVDASTLPVPAFYRIRNEFVYCTAKTGNTLTCERGRLGSTAIAHNRIWDIVDEALDSSEDDIDVPDASFANFIVPGYYRVEQEILNCTHTADSIDTLRCLRGAVGTAAAAHSNARTVNAAVNNTSNPVNITLNSATDVSGYGYYRIDSEVVRCTGGKSGNILQTCARAQMGTTIASHAVGANVRPVIDSIDVTEVKVWPSQRASKNRVHYFRRALRLVNGANTAGANNLPTPGFTVAAENPVYVLGNYNAYTGSTGFDGPHSYSAIIADAVTLLSNAWSDDNSFQFITTAGRVRSETNYRVAIAAGKGMNFEVTADSLAADGATTDFGTDGGTHNFLRFLEQGGSNIWYRGSIVSLFYYRQATGTYKCCSAVYGAPGRQYTFDTDFLVPSQLPPGTPRFRDINNLSFRQTIRADQ